MKIKKKNLKKKKRKNLSFSLDKKLKTGKIRIKPEKSGNPHKKIFHFLKDFHSLRREFRFPWNNH